MSGRGRALFVRTSWFPLATFLVARLYVGGLEGWGQWAAAPVVLGPVFLSGVFLLAGGAAARAEHRERGVRGSTWAALVLASAPCLWLVWRLIATT